MRIGLFGGTFDPIHHGHLILAQELLDRGPLDRVRFVPAARSPFKPDATLASAEDRLEMIRLAIASQPAFEVSDLEIRRGGPSYTIETVEALRAGAAEGDTLVLILGADSVPGLGGWYEAERLLDLCPVLVAARRGHDPEDADRTSLPGRHRRMLRAGYRETPQIEISATEIRRRRAEGRSIAYLVPPAVEAYIEGRGMYLTGRPGDR